MSRELTRQEKTAIRKLVTKWCANYDKDYGCLPLDCPCYMLGKCWTGAYCRYFRSAVLPLDPVLERSLTVERITETRPCPVCGRAFLPDGRQVGRSTLKVAFFFHKVLIGTIGKSHASSSLSVSPSSSQGEVSS